MAGAQLPRPLGGRACVEDTGPGGGPVVVYDPAHVRESPVIADAARDYLAALAEEAAIGRRLCWPRRLTPASAVPPLSNTDTTPTRRA